MHRTPLQRRRRMPRASLALFALTLGCQDPSGSQGVPDPNAPSFAAEWRLEACYPVNEIGEPTHSAFPSLQVLADSTLVVAYRSGSDHVSPDGALVLRRSADGGATWSAPEQVYRDPAYDARDPHLTVLADGRWVINFFEYDVPGRRPHAVRMIVSDDQGKSWRPATGPPAPFGGWSASSDGVLPLGPDTLLLPVYGKESGDSRESVRVMRSPDGGANWDAGPVVAEGGRDFQEPALGRRPDGSVLALMRTSGDDLYGAVSRDGGLTWTSPRRAFQGSGSPHLILLSNGRLLASYRAMVPGYPVGLRLSDDGGETWGDQHLLDAAGEVRSTYAQAVELSPTRIGLVYGSETGYRSHIRYCSFASTAPETPPDP